MALSVMRTSRRLLGRVALIGAGGGIGQPLSLLLKTNPRVKSLNLYDITNTAGIAADLSHISTPAKVTGFGKDDLASALRDVDMIIIPAGVPRKPGMTRDDLFNTNASIVYNIVEQAAKTSPKAALLIITNPVNSTVPIAAEVLRKAGCYNPKKLFGVTTLDLVRSKCFVRDLKGVDFDVPVIGGHSAASIVPLLSRVPNVNWTNDELASLTKRIQYAGDEVVKAKDGAGSATLSMAYAGVRMADSLMRAASGENVKEWSFVRNDVSSLKYFATSVQLGKDYDWVEADPIPDLSEFEKKLYAECVEQLAKDIKKGEEWATSKQ